MVESSKQMNFWRRLENDADLLALVKDCRRSHHLINIYFEHVVSKPHVVDCMSKDGDDVLQLPTILEPPEKPKPWTKPQATKGFAKPTPADKINKKVKDTTKTKSRRQVKAIPIDNESDSHDSYESAVDSLYKPPKFVGDYIYNGDSDSGVDGGQSSRAKKVDHREKHRPAADKARDKAIDTDESSYEVIESDECSDAEDSDQELDSDNEGPTVHPQYNDKAKFGDLKFEVSMVFKSKKHFMAATRDYTIQWGRNIRFSKNARLE
ncbi:hypothetical protein Ahy_B02g060872 [Arachis hypogaea]|uniref:Transposase MuDR plant domain-containing protein n=1 Tax=Arachis hypogaea TaxID=3818 RepID=A0A445AJH9_ARAHY|nr:hypothetical protein Ahy_B02g060872 [Arachis hypogaea]